jgi:hypothetical protein
VRRAFPEQVEHVVARTFAAPQLVEHHSARRREHLRR